MNPLDDDNDDEFENMIFRAVAAFQSEWTKPRSDPILAFLHGLKTLIVEIAETGVIPIPKETP